MNKVSLIKATIRKRFMFAAVTPLVLITVLMTSYVVQARQKDAREQFMESSRISTAYLGDSAVLELFSGDLKELQRIADSNTQVPDLVGVAWFDTDNRHLVSSKLFSTPAQLLTSTHSVATYRVADVLYIRQPVYTEQVAVDDYVEVDAALGQQSNSSRHQLVGWVIAGFDSSDNRERQQSIVLTGIGIALAGLVVAILLSIYFGRGIVRPVRKLTTTIKQMESGDLDVVAEAGNTIELAALAQGINQLAASVAEGQRSLEGKVHNATWRLEETLSNLRDKNRELEVARETAEAADQAKSEFLARMSHELRTPITAIQGFIRLLQNTNLGDAERNYCTIINQSSSQLLNLIDDILAISRLQSNAIEIEATPFNLIETLERAVGQMALPASDKGLELILDIAPEVPSTVVGDEFRMAQVITNLVSNAVKFTHSGHVRTSVTATPIDDQYSSLEISVSDTGIGIPEHKQDSLFQAFAQADTSITRQFGGTGLGLAIVKNLLDLMGGTITLDSTAGQGTTFRIDIPVPFTAIDSAPPAIDARVILIDEHPLSRDAVTDTLCRFVTELEVPEPPYEITDQSPDAVVLSLPSSANDKDNEGCIADLLKATKSPLLVLSAKPSIHSYIEKQQQQSAAIRYLDKPASLVSLHRALQQLIVGSPSQVVPESEPQENRALSGLRILIAEDNPFTREFLKTLLSREGAFCTTAANGLEAIKACQHDQFSVMLVDIHMPEKSGIETVQDIRSSGINQDTPIITITADVLQQERDDLTKAGTNDLLFKPVDEQLLIERILYHCRPSQSAPVIDQPLNNEVPSEDFFQEVDRLMEQLTVTCQQGDLEAARDPVHQLMGIAGVFKLPELEVRVANLHRSIKHHRHTQVESALIELQQEVARLCSESLNTEQ